MTLATTRNLLEHSFYRRWLAGTLTLVEMRDYAGQYAHVVAALPEWLRQAAAQNPGDEADLLVHAREEERHVTLWNRFAAALDMTADEVRATAPNAATSRLLEQAGTLASGPAGIAVAWAVESQSAPVSREKLSGLEKHYGITGEGLDYFRLHGELDVDHTAELDALLSRLGEAGRKAAQETAATVEEGLWDLLTSVERAA